MNDGGEEPGKPDDKKYDGNYYRHLPSGEGKGFVQPLRPHEHWHVDVSYINIADTFYYLCSLLDCCSRFRVHWEIRETMTEVDVEQIVQRARANASPASRRASSRTTAPSSSRGMSRSSSAFAA